MEFILFSIGLGAIIGSFLNVVILRLPKGEHLGGRSHCPKCGRILKSLDLVPVLSYVGLMGKCRGCETRISPRYAVIELVVASLFAFGYWWVSPVDLLGYLEVIRLWFILCVLVVVFVIDLEHFLILDKVVFPAVGVVFLLNILVDFNSGVLDFRIWNLTFGGLIASFLTSGFLWLIWKISNGRWIGFGDVKLMWFLGQALGFPLGIFGFFLSFIIGSLYSMPFLVLGKYSMASKLPLGSFLAVGGLVTIFWGERLLDIYLRLVGLR